MSTTSCSGSNPLGAGKVASGALGAASGAGNPPSDNVSGAQKNPLGAQNEVLGAMTNIVPLSALNVSARGGNRRKVILVQDSHLSYPEMYLEVYVHGDQFEQRAFAEMFVRSKCTRADTPEEADIVVFTGGHDVNPALYNEEKHFSTSFSDGRDTSDILMYQRCVEQGIPMFGVCRGAQFLHVMNGGKLFQDVDAHNGAHAIYDRRTKNVIQNVSSVHHQACRPNTEGGMEILATTSKSRVRALNNLDVETGQSQDIEAYFYRDTCCLGVQGHPEYRNYNAYTKWCLDQINDLIVCNPDTDWQGGRRRVKDDLVKQRAAGWAAKKEKV